VKTVIKTIDRAIKRLYNIDLKFKAENFVLRDDEPIVIDGEEEDPTKVRSGQMHAALLVKTEGENAQELSVGIFLSHAMRDILASINHWDVGSWNHSQVSAFVAAAEEISHFNYLLFHSSRGRKVSQLELELQADVDKFLLVFFSVIKGRETTGAFFERLYDQLFLHFRLREGLSREQRERYENANTFAKAFVLKFRPLLKQKSSYSQALQLARHFYRVNCAEKISLSQK
jgi:hypothetical protein